MKSTYKSNAINYFLQDVTGYHKNVMNYVTKL